MKSWLKRLWWIVLAAVGLALLIWAFIPTPVEVDLARVERGPLRVTVDQEGQTRVRERYVISAPVSGILRRIPFKAGDPVEAGKTVLAVIDPTLPALLDVRARGEAEARVRAAEAAVRQAEPTIERADYELQQAQLELRRISQLFERGSASQDEFQEAGLRVAARRAELAAARSARDVAAFQLEQARATLRYALGGTDNDAMPMGAIRLTSPVSGQVLRVIRESESPVTSGSDLLEIGDASDLEAVIDVLSRDAVNVRRGAAVMLERWGGDRPLQGVVRRVEPSGFTKISALGVEEQRVNVIVDFVESVSDRGTIGDGFRVDARIVVWEQPDVIKVPTGALMRREDAWMVLIHENGRASLRRVEIGQMSRDEAQILEGLQDGDMVLLHPSDQVQDGTRIAPRREVP